MDSGWTSRSGRRMILVVAVRADRRTLDEQLEAARTQIARGEPLDARAATGPGALLIDIRADVDRERDGIVPGSLHIPRTVLEWRLDPNSASARTTKTDYLQALR